MKSKIAFLTKQFYVDHPSPPFSEIEQKENRPYIVFLVQIDGHTWGLPFRSHIKHRYAYWTDRANGCGIDFTKAVVLDDPKYIDSTTKPYLRPNEFAAIKGNEHLVLRGFARYVRLYKKALQSNQPRDANLLRFSTLQNYYQK